MLLFGASASPPKVVPLPDTIPATALTPGLPEIMQFSTVTLLAPSLALALAIQITAALALPFLMVRPKGKPPQDPSMITPSGPLSLIKPPPVDTPEIVRAGSMHGPLG